MRVKKISTSLAIFCFNELAETGVLPLLGSIEWWAVFASCFNLFGGWCACAIMHLWKPGDNFAWVDFYHVDPGIQLRSLSLAGSTGSTKSSLQFLLEVLALKKVNSKSFWLMHSTSKPSSPFFVILYKPFLEELMDFFWRKEF